MKKITAALLALAMLLSLCACGQTSSPPASNPANSQTPSGSGGNAPTQPSGSYPEKDITVLIPKNPGGGTDTSARAFMQFAQEYLPSGVNFVGVNNSEGNGVIAMEQLADSEGDGYTIGMVVCEAAMMPWQGQMEKTVSDYRTLALTIADPMVLAVKADAPYNTAEEFVAYCKDHPGEVLVANAGLTSACYIAADQFASHFDLEFVHVPYETGSGDAVAALVGGHVDAFFGTPGTVKAQVEAGELKWLGVMSDQRLVLYPDIPTMEEELGFEFTLSSWAAMCAPKGLNDEAYEYLCDIFQKVAEDPDFQKYMADLGIEPVVCIGQDAQDVLESDSVMYKEVIEASAG